MRHPNSTSRRGRPVNEDARKERRSQILDAAQRCFIRKGFHGTSTAEISKEADISIAGLYQYFDSKDALIIALVERDLANNLGLAQALLQSDDFFSTISTILDAFSPNSEIEGSTRLRVEIIAEATRNDEVAEALANAESRLIAALVRAVTVAQSRQQIDASLDPYEVAVAIDCISDGVFSRLCLPTSRRIPIVQSTMKILSRALLPNA